jgi:hypothetical protein
LVVGGVQSVANTQPTQLPWPSQRWPVPVLQGVSDWRSLSPQQWLASQIATLHWLVGLGHVDAIAHAMQVDVPPVPVPPVPVPPVPLLEVEELEVDPVLELDEELLVLVLVDELEEPPVAAAPPLPL